VLTCLSNGLIAASQAEDEEEAGRTPSPDYSDGHVPVWHESSRMGQGKQDSKQPLPNSQVCKEAT